MKFEWNLCKNKKLIESRGISFEHIIEAISKGKILDILRHHNKEKYPEQYLIIVEINNYAYVVPCYIKNDVIFFITAYPSRKMTKRYLKERQDGERKT